MDRGFFSWGATAEIIRRSRKSPEALRLVEWILEASRPGTMRCLFDMSTTYRDPFETEQRSREKIAEIDGELLSRANRFGGGYQPLNERIVEDEDLVNNNNQQKPEFLEEEKEPENEGESQIVQGANFTIVDPKAYNTEGREAQFIHINQVIEKMVGDEKVMEDAIQKAEFSFMLDLKTLIAKSATDPELNRVRDAMRRAEKNAALEFYPPAFEKSSNK